MFLKHVVCCKVDSQQPVESMAHPLIFFRKVRIFWKHGVMLNGRLPTISEVQQIIDAAMLFVF